MIYFVLIALNANSQTYTKNITDSAKIMFVDTVYDFGTIYEANGKVSHVFEFKNVGGMPLVVLNAKASCGCTVPEWTKTPIDKGGSGTIEVTFNPAKRAGKFNKAITITSNAAGQYSVVYIKGEIKPTVATEFAHFKYKMKHRHFGVWDYVLGGAGIVIVVIALFMFFSKKKKRKIEN